MNGPRRPRRPWRRQRILRVDPLRVVCGALPGKTRARSNWELILARTLKGIKPIHEIAADNEVPPVQVSQWKEELQDRMAEILERKNARSNESAADQKLIERLERKVGQVVVERDWLAKKCKELGID